jgi:hypothetical protein
MSSLHPPAATRVTPAAVPSTAAPRPPVTALAAGALVALLAVATAYGSFWFSFVDGSPGIRPGYVVFVALYWAVDAVALAAAAGLLRRRPAARRVLAGYAVAGMVFTAVKIIAFRETEAVVFGVVGLLLLALLQAPATRRYAS